MLISQDGLGLEGDCHETFQVPIEVREMDLADRYLNTQCVRQDWEMARNGWQGDLNDLRWKIFQWWIPVTWRISLTWKLEGGLEDWLLRWLPGKCSPHTKAVTMRMFERVSTKNLKNSGSQMVGFVSWIHPSKTTGTIFVAAPAMI